jgi:exosortase
MTTPAIWTTGGKAGPAGWVTRWTLSARWQRFAVALAAIELLLLYAPTVGWLWGRWTMDVWHQAHGLLVTPAVGYFVYRELRDRPDLPWGTSPWGFAIVVPALALLALDAGMHTELLSAASLVLLLPGLALLLIGTARTRAILFPLTFLGLGLPIPLALTEQIHWQLRLLTTAVTAEVLPMLGVPIFTEGTTLHTAAGVLQVADACSGFTTLYAALAVACLVAYSTSGTKRRVIVLLSAAPLAIASNLVRVIGLVLLVVWQGEDILTTFIHPLSGMMTFAVTLPIIFWLGERPQRERPS